MDFERDDLEDLALRDADLTGAAWEVSPMLDGECIGGSFGMTSACEDREGYGLPDCG